jgi:hypothetical protein
MSRHIGGLLVAFVGLPIWKLKMELLWGCDVWLPRGVEILVCEYSNEMDG